MMRLFYSPFHAFVHKSLVVIHEAGVADQVIYVPTFPFRNTEGEAVYGKYPMMDINPLGKVPTLALEDGTVLYGSQCVVEYLDSLSSGRRLFPPDGAQRWDALRRLALGDTLFELGVQMALEGRVPAAEPRPGLYDWLQPKVAASFDLLELEAKGYADFDIGHVGLLQGISYSEMIYQARADDSLYPSFDWRQGRSNLTAWYDGVITRPSVESHLNKPYPGDMSPEFHQQQVAEVIDAQRANGLRHD